MAKKSKEKIVLENVELKPQVIGYTFKKKNNLGRVLLIFIAFALVVYYINDISVFFNNLLGRETASTISGQNKDDDEPEKNPTENPDDPQNETQYYIFNSELEIDFEGLKLNNFKLSSNVLSFDVTNNSSSTINLSDKKIFLETYTENKTLLERLKVDFNSINGSGKVTINVDIKNAFYYLMFVEKSVNDYPNFDLGNTTANLTCRKGIDTIVYSFNNNSLLKISHNVSNNNVNAADYQNKLSEMQTKVDNYNSMPGFTAIFNATAIGYTANVTIDLEKAKLNNIQEPYYYAYEEHPKVVNFEMETYGFNCE